MLDLSLPAVYVPAIFLTLVFVLAVFIAKEAKNTGGIVLDKLPYYGEINLSMGYIGRNVLENGRFNYRKNVDPEVKYSNKIYNSLRHAGILYSMYVYEQHGYPAVYKKYRYKAAKYFIKKYIKKLDETRKVVVSLPKEEQINMSIAKSGAAGVALAALSNLYSENKIPLEVLTGLGEFLVSMQNDDGNFYAYYDLESNTVNKEAEALYYTGEAAFGLLHLNDVDPKTKWLHSAKKGLLFLAKSRKPLDMDIPFDHWSIMAIEKLFRTGSVTDEEKRLLMEYVEQMLIPTITKQITNKNNSYFGAFQENIRPGSIGTIMEGLASSYFCTDSEDLKQLIYKSLSIGCLFLNRVQVKTGEQAGGVPNSANWVRPEASPNAGVIRMDNIQHVILSWLKFQDIIQLQNDLPE